MEIHELDGPWTNKGTVNLVLIDENGTEIENTVCLHADMEDVKNRMRRDYFNVSDLIKEIKNLEYDIYLTDDNQTGKTYSCKFKRGQYTFELPFSTGISAEVPTYDAVLESYLSDAFSVSEYANGPDDEDGFIGWSDDLDYPSQGTRGLLQAQKGWELSWVAKYHLWTLFSKTELDNIKHAFEEGRNR